jgi:hypothetical protein
MRTNNYESAVDFIINVGASIQKSKRTKAQLYFSQAIYHFIISNSILRCMYSSPHFMTHV